MFSSSVELVSCLEFGGRRALRQGRMCTLVGQGTLTSGLASGSKHTSFTPSVLFGSSLVQGPKREKGVSVEDGRQWQRRAWHGMEGQSGVAGLRQGVATPCKTAVPMRDAPNMPENMHCAFLSIS